MRHVVGTAEAGGLAATLLALDAADPYRRHLAGAQSGDGWLRLDELLAGGALLSAWFDSLVAGEARGHRDVAGSYLAGWLAEAIAGPVAAAFELHRRTWPLDPATLRVRRHAEGWVDAVAVDPPFLR